MALDLKVSPSTDSSSISSPDRGRPLLELSGGYGLILATIWTPRPYQQWLYCIAVAWIVVPSALAFPGWAAMAFRRFRDLCRRAIAHALLGITVAITIPGPVVRNMRVGMGYLRYHAPHAHPPGLEPTPTTR